MHTPSINIYLNLGITLTELVQNKSYLHSNICQITLLGNVYTILRVLCGESQAGPGGRCWERSRLGWFGGLCSCNWVIPGIHWCADGPALCQTQRAWFEPALGFLNTVLQGIITSLVASGKQGSFCKKMLHHLKNKQHPSTHSR